MKKQCQGCGNLREIAENETLCPSCVEQRKFTLTQEYKEKMRQLGDEHNRHPMSIYEPPPKTERTCMYCLRVFDVREVKGKELPSRVKGHRNHWCCDDCVKLLEAEKAADEELGSYVKKVLKGEIEIKDIPHTHKKVRKMKSELNRQIESRKNL